MATRKQQLIRTFGRRIYFELVDVLREMRLARRGNVILRSIEIEKGTPLTPEKRQEIEALFK